MTSKSSLQSNAALVMMMMTVAWNLHASPANAAAIDMSAEFSVTGSLQAVSVSTFSQANAFDFGPAGSGIVDLSDPSSFYADREFDNGLPGVASNIKVAEGPQTTNLYTFTTAFSTLDFQITNISSVERLNQSGTSTIELFGSGLLSLTGYDRTPENFTLTAQQIATSSLATFQSTVGPVAIPSGVPEPSTWAMMLLGFGGLGFLAYRRTRGAGATSMIAA